jgi:CubicO group peptidase (beta-lactamase class C family)
VVTDVTQQDFPTIARSVLFEPLGIARSTYANPLSASVGNVAKAHDRQGRPTALPRGYEAMPEMAASGLWTSAAELGQFVAMLIESYRAPGGYLPQTIAEDMMTRVEPGEHGIGPRIEGIGARRRFQHGGANDSYKAWIEAHLQTGDGFVVLTNGNRGHELHREIRKAAADMFGW